MIRIFCVLLLQVLTTTCAWAYSRVEILAVGISSYDRGVSCKPKTKSSEAWCNLPNGHVDVKKLQTAIAVRPWLNPVKVTVLPEASSTRRGILKALRMAAKRANRENSLLVFYFVGHGKSVGSSGYLVPKDADPTDPDSWLSMDKLLSVLKEFRSINQQLLILGSCFGGEIFRSEQANLKRMNQTLGKAPKASAQFIERETQKRARVALTAGRKDELVPDGFPGIGSKYGRAVADAFGGGTAEHLIMPGDLNGDRCISHLELAAYLANEGKSAENQPQIGHFHESERGSILFCEKGAGTSTEAPDDPSNDRGSAPLLPDLRPFNAPKSGFLRKFAGISFRYVRAGRKFLLGNNRRGATSHLVYLTRDFWISEDVVTKAQATSLIDQPFEGDCPECAQSLTFVNAAILANALSAKLGRPWAYEVGEQDVGQTSSAMLGVRLPTEAEWVYAARAGRMSIPPQDYQDDVTEQTEILTKNGWGLVYRSKVEDWTGDWFGDFGPEDVIDPTGPTVASAERGRGGRAKRVAMTRSGYRTREYTTNHNAVRLVIPAHFAPKALNQMPKIESLFTRMRENLSSRSWTEMASDVVDFAYRERGLRSCPPEGVVDGSDGKPACSVAKKVVHGMQGLGDPDLKPDLATMNVLIGLAHCFREESWATLFGDAVGSGRFIDTKEKPGTLERLSRATNKVYRLDDVIVIVEHDKARLVVWKNLRDLKRWWRVDCK